MAREEQYRGYYDSIIQNKSYIDTRLSIRIAVADFLAQTFFGKDFSRVIYTNPEFAFRKRLERLANGVENESIFVTDLQLPFCSFHLSGAPEIIKTAAASEWRGYYDEDLEQRMHFINTLQKCTVQFYFARTDDATVAFDIAQRESLAEYPIRYIQEIFWRNTTLKFPVWITVKKVRAGNESFDETKWLSQNHMYAMTLDLEIEVARLHIHKGLNAVQLPFKWHSTGNNDTWEDGTPEYYVQKSILMWANKSMKIDVTCPDEPTNEAREVYETLLKNDQLALADANTLKQIQSVLPNGHTAEIIEGFFRDSTRIAFNRLAYNAEKTTISDKGEVTAYIDFLVKPATYNYWDYTEFVVPGRSGGTITIKNCKDKAVLVSGLHPNSTYEAYFIAHDINGDFNTIPFTFTTPVWEKETLPAVNPENPKPSDVVTTVEATKHEEEPTINRLNGLIGMEL